ncbi:hypothetical protein BC828DRAFT_351264 [Blastocladiella britannica]|nr:hypothetical protein BC828DRAFT_351264 [Blastocladiella britannica]
MIAALNGTCRDAGLLCTFVGSIGQSVEGRDIAAVRIGAPSASPKPQVYVQATLHAREWGAASTAHYIAHALLTNYTLDNDTRRFLDTYDVHIVPVANPDGYTWTWEENGDRLWRKNRRQNADGSIGVDLNRNWDFSWDDLSGSSDVAQDETYRGPSPGSEPETRALAKYFSSLTNVVASIDMHTFSQLILLPWGNTRTPTPGNDDYVAVGQLMHSAIAAVNGSDYLSVPSMDLYPTSGTASDWFYSQTKRGTDGRSLAPYAYILYLYLIKELLT